MIHHRGKTNKRTRTRCPVMQFLYVMLVTMQISSSNNTVEARVKDIDTTFILQNQSHVQRRRDTTVVIGTQGEQIPGNDNEMSSTTIQWGVNDLIIDTDFANSESDKYSSNISSIYSNNPSIVMNKQERIHYVSSESSDAYYGSPVMAPVSVSG